MQNTRRPQGGGSDPKQCPGGARNMGPENMLRKELLDTIRIVDSGRRRIPPESARELGEHVIDDELSDREIEVLKLIATGTSNKIIASQLSLAETTIKTHVQNILLKLDANDRTHAVTIAIKRGYIDLG